MFIIRILGISRLCRRIRSGAARDDRGGELESPRAPTSRDIAGIGNSNIFTTEARDAEKGGDLDES
jgi:hypothetical protein